MDFSKIHRQSLGWRLWRLKAVLLRATFYCSIPHRAAQCWTLQQCVGQQYQSCFLELEGHEQSLMCSQDCNPIKTTLYTCIKTHTEAINHQKYMLPTLCFILLSFIVIILINTAQEFLATYPGRFYFLSVFHIVARGTCMP